MSDIPHAAEIPEDFWSEYSEKPFAVCIECDAPLTGGNTPYAIQKHFVAGEAVFEMAICIDCASRLQESFSVESRQALVEAIRLAPERKRRQEDAANDPPLDLHDGSDFANQVEQLAQRVGARREQAMSSCGICAKPRTDCHRYSLGTACLGKLMITEAPDLDNLGSPFLICEDCEHRLNDCISQQTRDAWNRFVEDHFDGPPSLAVDPREIVAMF